MKYIGVTGCLPVLPDTFPLETPENSGNTVHANAPFEMYGERAVFSRGTVWKALGYDSFPAFVNDRCSHLVITMANTIRDGKPELGERYASLQRSLGQYKVPIVVFGFGVQAKQSEVASVSIPPEGIELVRYLSSRASALGVRGQFTADVFAHHAGVTNTFVTGCPSLFSRPHALAALRSNWQRSEGPISYAGTNYNDATEQQLFRAAVENDRYLIEPVNRALYSVSLGNQDPIPGGLRKLGMNETISAYLRRRLRLFRNTPDWYAFNEGVGATFGTRFHVNMASILSGKPALWLTHDSRTRELVETMSLPSLPLADMAGRTDVPEMDYSLFFSRINEHFDNFNVYLATNGLPPIRTLSDVEQEEPAQRRGLLARLLGR